MSRTVINITQHNTSPDQVEAGIEDLSPDHKTRLKELLTFDEIPHLGDIWQRADTIVSFLTDECGLDPDKHAIMVGGAPFFLPALVEELRTEGFIVYHAFTKRVVEEKDGVKKAVFRHEGLIKDVTPS
jgi:hypothetical protein